MKRLFLALSTVFLPIFFAHSQSPSLETRLKAVPINTLASRVEERGSAKRGALVFFRSAAGCAKCHADSGKQSPLGPSLAAIGADGNIGYTIESLLYPSKRIRDQYKTTRIINTDGESISGIIVSKDADKTLLRDAMDLNKELTVAEKDIETVSTSKISMMPEGLVAALRDEREFYDLVRYVSQVALGGDSAADSLRPSADKLVIKDDTIDLDHAGILGSLGDKDFRQGKQIYNSHCVNCHGADGNTPALATARAFGTQKLKFGADPFSMLGTLTRGNGLMAAMQHLSPKERYQAIHFIRQQFMKSSNSDYRELSPKYLASLPKGTRSGEFELQGERDFGPVLGSQLGNSINHALTFRLPNEITVNYDMHRFRLGGVWQGGFLDLSQTQHYRQRGERMPQPKGTPLTGLSNYGWQLADTYELSADNKPPRGPVSDQLAKYRGHYLYDDQAVLSYEIAGRGLLESIAAEMHDGHAIVQHTLNVKPGDQELRLSVAAKQAAGPFGFKSLSDADSILDSAIASGHVALATSKHGRAFESGSSKNVARYIVAKNKAKSLDLGTPDRSVVVRFRTNKGGTLISSAPEKGPWAPNGKTLFVRGRRLVFDIGWVGAISSKSTVADNQWHTAVLHVGKEQTRLFIDGKLEAQKKEFRRDAVAEHVLKVGATAVNFGGDFVGDIDFAAILDGDRSDIALQELSKRTELPGNGSRWSWTPAKTNKSTDAKEPIAAPPAPVAMATVVGDIDGLRWEKTSDDRLVLVIPPSQAPRVFSVIRTERPASQLTSFLDIAKARAASMRDPATMTQGGPRRWPQELRVAGELGDSVNGYALDTITVPPENPWNAWLRTSALDFMSDGRCVVATHGGDVFLVSGIDGDLQHVTWRRFASGLFEPFGVRVVDDQIYVTCRDGINRLHDFDENGEADFIEAFWIDDDVSSMFHAYNFDLQTDSDGNFYFAKAGQYTNHHRPGTIMKIPPQGGSATVVAWGIRTPNGMGKLNDDRFTVSDNQGPWMPAGKISLIKQDAFLGNMPINKEQDQWLRSKHGGELPKTFDEPFIWMPQDVDNSCGGQLWVDDKRWGPLSGRLIHSSFGKGWLYYLSLQEIDGAMQSSIVSLPHQWLAGVMRLRVNPADGQVYGTGLSGWQGPKGGKDGCLQRLRYTNLNVRMIEQTKVVEGGLELTFNFDVGDGSLEPKNWSVEMWDYQWSKRYGSDQFSVLKPGTKGRDKLRVQKLVLRSPRTIFVSLPQLTTCDQLKVDLEIFDKNRKPFSETVHMTIHCTK